MAKFCVELFDFEGLKLITPTVFNDHRGYFLETFNESELKNIGIDVQFVQDNESKSIKGVLRGLHFQSKNPQGKLVRVIQGEIFDVVVDLRKESKTYMKWLGITLSDKQKKMLYIPPGFAHGFLVMSDEAVLSYKCTTFYDPNSDSGIRFDDCDLNIQWPELEGIEYILSDKDRSLMCFSEFKSPF